MTLPVSGSWCLIFFNIAFCRTALLTGFFFILALALVLAASGLAGEPLPATAAAAAAAPVAATCVGFPTVGTSTA